ncbi:MAG TPA: chemotaxis protein CheW [Gemmatimonadaceae bacterium]|jgi:purine-binding chemotaxis protein CheW|nr:chemotaxis protein CheW [Gemmatimonadaceae bacterium]
MSLETSTQQQSQYLTFVVGDAEYGVGILRAKEIIEYDTVTTVPNAPHFVRGVINLRGRVVSVVDLAVRFGRQPAEVTRRSCIVVVEVDRDGVRDVVGIVADRVSEVAELPPDSIEPPPSFGSGVRTEWLLGLGRVDKRFVLLLDTDRVLSDWEAGSSADAPEGLGAVTMAVG